MEEHMANKAEEPATDEATSTVVNMEEDMEQDEVTADGTVARRREMSRGEEAEPGVVVIVAN
ncbi:hypothetical protein E2562_010159 [Oryza meyeriana var. granulata]|uniref:Uncharacterized protein n=1 Tax=Oryza meyeriana var. granulata TaxID=110450 RepID=A0A6G1EJC5_9ORYZ|nr:hypothetical protein E2562_010159 [Oryza meyeriana var. granulata]